MKVMGKFKNMLEFISIMQRFLFFFQIKRGMLLMTYMSPLSLALVPEKELC